MEIRDRSALVLGGASGLGAAAATVLRERGAPVTIADIDAARGQSVADRLGGAFVQCDALDEDAVGTAVEEAAGRGGDRGLRIAVACAGIAVGERVASAKKPHALASFRRVLDVNLVGTFNLLRLAAYSMLGNEPDEGGERGVIVLTASIAAFEGQVGQIAYSASKGGIVGMVLPAARDLAPEGVRVVAIAPGTFDTPLLAGLGEDVRAALADQVPFPSRLGRPEEFGEIVRVVVENPMLNGTTIRLDGALRMPPR